MEDRSVVVGMSGGVDSTIAAFKLVESGFDVRGLFLCMWGKRCEQAFEHIEKIADFIGIPVELVDVSEEFYKDVIEKSAEFLKRGLTPNPCIWCNPRIKFKTFFRYGKLVATGHYAIVEKIGERAFLKRGVDRKKEQSYFLYALPRDSLFRIMFPLGNMKKNEVRKIAKDTGVLDLVGSESQDLCFVNDAKTFFKEVGVGFSAGDIFDTQGRFLGIHKGLPFYTIGQRKGLGLGGGPFYVLQKDIAKNRLIVGRKEDCMFKEAIVGDVNLIQEDIRFPVDVDVKIRYAFEPVPATVEKDERYIVVRFHRPQFAVTPGQSAVFYQDDYLIGGGIIYEAIR